MNAVILKKLKLLIAQQSWISASWISFDVKSRCPFYSTDYKPKIV